MESVIPVKEMIHHARIAESAGDQLTAVQHYEKIIRSDPLNEFAYDRLMILYRKNKDLKKELGTINSAIRVYEKFYKSRASKSKKINDISARLSKAVGLVDKQGMNLYDPEPIAGWKKRKSILEKKKK
ncbi:MAG: bacterial transcriptional activator domain-containing protein [Ginsengibacter sp.]